MPYIFYIIHKDIIDFIPPYQLMDVTHCMFSILGRVKMHAAFTLQKNTPGSTVHAMEALAFTIQKSTLASANDNIF